MPTDSAERLYRFTFVLILALAVFAAFLFLVSDFLIDIVLAAIFAGLLHPLLEKSLPAFGGRRGIAAAAIVIGVVLAVALPLAAIMTMVGSEAVEMSQKTALWVQTVATHPQSIIPMLPGGFARADSHRAAIASFTAHLADAVNALSSILSRWLMSATRGAVSLFFDLFVILFALPYFLQSGPALVERVMERIPVSRAEARTIVDKTLKTTASTLRGIVVVGTAQGVLIGTGFEVAGIGQPWFWGTIAAAASSVPGFGSGLVWAPGALYLLLTGHIAAGIGLAAWGIAVVLIADDWLRAVIVGRGAAIPAFLVFISTLGGLTVLGPAGILIGPVLAGTLIGVLNLYYAVLRSSGLLNGNA